MKKTFNTAAAAAAGYSHEMERTDQSDLAWEICGGGGVMSS